MGISSANDLFNYQRNWFLLNAYIFIGETVWHFHSFQYSATQIDSFKGQGAPACNDWQLAAHVVRTGDVDLVILELVGQTNYAMTLDKSLPTFGDKMVGHGGVMQ